MSGRFELKGLHVLAAFVLFFGAVIAVNVAFTRAALHSFPGEEDHKAYFQGLHYNETLAERARQKELGWTASLVEANLDGVSAVFRLRIADKTGAPLAGLEMDGVIRRTTHSSEDTPLHWNSLGKGLYEARADNVGAGLWEFRANAKDAENDPFAIETRVVLK
ncbi:MAG: FixH family protein [Parvularculaceae bacterium]